MISSIISENTFFKTFARAKNLKEEWKEDPLLNNVVIILIQELELFYCCPLVSSTAIIISFLLFIPVNFIFDMFRNPNVSNYTIYHLLQNVRLEETSNWLPKLKLLNYYYCCYLFPFFELLTALIFLQFSFRYLKRYQIVQIDFDFFRMAGPRREEWNRNDSHAFRVKFLWSRLRGG